MSCNSSGKFKFLAVPLIFALSLLISSCESLLDALDTNTHKPDKMLLAKFPELKPELERMVQIIKNYEQSKGTKLRKGIMYADQIGKEYADQDKKLEQLHIIYIEADCFFTENSVCFKASDDDFTYTRREGEQKL